ncbi:hypothetical protein DMUE_4095 [Dictyocoela muelleri]|nr:hypothetical protein DMUE_4095 [Dictyocoela muelleri]
MIIITDDEINHLILKYLQKEGYIHTSFIFQNEAKILDLKNLINSKNDDPAINLKNLKNDNQSKRFKNFDLTEIIEKGIKAIYLENHFGSIECKKTFTITNNHECQARELKLNFNNLDTISGNHLSIFCEEMLISTFDNKIFSYKDQNYNKLNNENLNYNFNNENINNENSNNKPSNLKSQTNKCDFMRKLYKSTHSINETEDITAITNFKKYFAIGTHTGKVSIYDKNLILQSKINIDCGPILSIKSLDNKMAIAGYNGNVYVHKPTINKVNNKNDTKVNNKNDNKVNNKNDDEASKNKPKNLKFKLHKNIVYDVLWINKSFLASCSADQTVTILDTQNLKTLQMTLDSEQTVLAVNNSCDYNNYNHETLLAVGGDSGVVTIWNIQDTIDSKLKHSLKAPVKFKHDKDVIDMKFTANELATVSFDKKFRIYDLQKNKIEHEFIQDAPIQVLQYLNKNNLFITGSAIDNSNDITDNYSSVVFYDKRCGEIKRFKGKSEVYNISVNDNENLICVSFAESVPIVVDLRWV